MDDIAPFTSKPSNAETKNILRRFLKNMNLQGMDGRRGWKGGKQMWHNAQV